MGASFIAPFLRCIHLKVKHTKKIILSTFSPFFLKKYFDLIISDEIPLKLKSVALASTWRQKQNHDLVIDFITTRHKEVNSV